MSSGNGRGEQIRRANQRRANQRNASFAWRDSPFKNPKICVGEKGIQSLLNFCKLRQNESIEERLERDVEAAAQILVHKSCRRDFTDKKRSFRTNEVTASDEPRPKLLRSSIGSYDFKSQCFLCGRSSTKDTKHPERNTIHVVTLLDFHRNLLEKVSKKR